MATLLSISTLMIVLVNKNNISRIEGVYTMKKILTSLFVLAFSLSVFTLPAFATSSTYELDELGLEVTIPSKYDVITQDTSPYSSIFSDRGLSGTDLIKQFKSTGVYLNAIPNDGTNEEIVVTMTDGVFNNLSEFSNGTLKTLASSLVKGYEDYGLTITNYDIYEHSQAKFIKLHITDTSNSFYGLQYYTNYDAKTINFTIRSYSGALSQTQEAVIKGVIDSIVFDTAPIPAPTVPETDAFEYIDVDTNTKFTVPANWHEKDLSKDREYIDVKFASGKEEGLSIMYGSTDLWSQMSESEKFGASRSDFDSSLFTVDDMKEYFGVDANNISKVTYNGIDYFIAEQKSKQEMYGMEFIVDMTRVVRFHNGWLYEFQFGGTKDSPYFTDFEKLLNSVEYENVDSTNPTTPVLLMIVMFGIIALVIVFVVRHNKKRNVKLNVSETILELDVSSMDEEGAICSNCGSNLTTDSLFCHICGTKRSEK